MNAIDVLIMLVLCAGAMIGFYHGLVRTVFHTVLLYGATVVAAFSYPALARALVVLFPTASLQLRHAAAFLFILLLLFNMIAFSVRAPFKSHGPFLPALFDKLCGMGAGFFMAGVWIGVGLLIVDFLLSVSWVKWEPLRYSLYFLLADSFLAGVVRGLLPYAVATLKPWFAPFGGLPRLFILQ